MNFYLYILFDSLVYALPESYEIAAPVRIFKERKFIIPNDYLKRLFASDKAFKQTHGGKVLKSVIEHFEP